MTARIGPSANRRTLLLGMASVLAASGVGEAWGQATMTDEEMTCILRGGGCPARGLAPSPSAPTSPPPPPRSTIPADEPVRARLDEVEFEVVIDRSASIDMHVQFAFDSAELDRRARRLLSTLGRLLQSTLRDQRYLIAGHTDITGPFDHNIKLSMWRALAVRRHLIVAYELNPRRLFAAGFGPTALRDRRNPASGINRRVEVVLVTDSR